MFVFAQNQNSVPITSHRFSPSHRVQAALPRQSSAKCRSPPADAAAESLDPCLLASMSVCSKIGLHQYMYCTKKYVYIYI